MPEFIFEFDLAWLVIFSLGFLTKIWHGNYPLSFYSVNMILVILIAYLFFGEDTGLVFDIVDNKNS